MFIDHQVVEMRAGEWQISVRAGCFCNPGAGELAMGISADEMRACFTRESDRLTYVDFARTFLG